MPTMNDMRMIILITVFLMVTSVFFARPRIVIMTDFPPIDVIPGGRGYGPAEKRSDPDDVQSMIRFLLYSNEFEVEGLVASSATFANIADKQNILDILYCYDVVQENLKKVDINYPSADRLRSITWQGASGTWGKSASEIIGENKDSEASEKIIELLDKPNTEPVWFCIWGGSCDLAQALWKIKRTRKPDDTKLIMSKIRIYMIGFQDGSGQWLLDNFPDMFIIVSENNYMGMFNNAPDSNIKLSDLDWINQNIRRGHGLLGALYPESGFYPETPGVWEGDSPSFLYLVSSVHGINDREKPYEDSWGGKFIRPDLSKNHWFDDPAGTKTVSKWRKEVQEDFARRADWMVK